MVVEPVKSKQRESSLWAELKFPPINLYNVWPTAAMCKLHAEQQDPSLWEDYD